MANKRRRYSCDICGSYHLVGHIGNVRKKCVKRQLEIALRDAMDRRDGGICQHCGKLDPHAHMSHVIRRSQDGRLSYDLENVKTLCGDCHFGWWHRDEFGAIEWFRVKFPIRYDSLRCKQLDHKQNPQPITMPWLLDRLEELRKS